MTVRTLSSFALTSIVLIVAGCNGPTKAGLEAREDANNRINAFSAGFTYDQARQEFLSGQFERAERSIGVAIEQAPELASYRVLQGRIYLETNRLQEAIDALNVAQEKDPEMPDVHYYKGIVYQRWSRDEEAYDAYRAAFELEPTNEQYLLATVESLIILSRLDEAETLVEERLDYFEHNPALRHVLSSIAQLKGEHARAAKLLEEACLLSPDEDALFEELAWAQYRAGQYGAGLDTLTLLEDRMVGDRPDLEHLKARCLTAVGQMQDAYRLYREVLRTDPTNESAWAEYGILAWELGDISTVGRAGARLISSAPDRYEGYLLRGVYERGYGHFAQAVELFEQAADRTRTDVMPLLLLGRTHEQMGNERVATAIYETAVELFPNSDHARRLLTAAASGSDSIASAEQP